MTQWLRHIIATMLLVLVQVFLANQMVLYDVATPYVFLLLLLFFPVESPRSVQYLVAFGVGLVVDVLSLEGAIGLHAFCAVLLMGLRQPVINFLGTSTSVRGTNELRLEEQDGLWYLSYFFPLILVYCLVYGFLEALSFQPLGLLLIRVLASAVYTTGLCLVATYLFYRR